MSEAMAGPSPAQPPVELLQQLTRFDTTNPPGNEKECIDYLDRLLTSAGFKTRRHARLPERPNLITRLAGRGEAPPLLIYGHIDVVTTAGQTWQHPPFGGDLIDDCVWGRGTVDMKGVIAMMVSALMRAKEVGLTPAGDVLLAVVSDEEAGGDYGAKYLVEHHADEFAGVRYAIGEAGSPPLRIGRQQFYPVAVSEKQLCQLRAHIHGPGGHASRAHRQGTMSRLANFLLELEDLKLPAHVTPVTRQMLDTLVSVAPPPLAQLLRQLYNPGLANGVLGLLGPLAQPLDLILRNSVNATMVRGGEKINVIPSEVVVDLDVRLLPGYSPADVISELRQGLVSDNIDFEILRFDPGPEEPDIGLLPTLTAVLREKDPTGIALPQMMTATSDARFFAQLGIQTYGLLPLQPPDGPRFLDTIHAADERLPVAALLLGTDVLYKLLQRYGT